MFKNLIVQNSFWAIFSNVFQNVIFSFFFIILARVYNQEIFSSYIIANTLYGLLLSFSSLGMAQWFIRADQGEGRKEIAQLFLNIQLFAGFVFYILNVFFSFLLYKEPIIHLLSIILGFNIVYDNLIYVYKTINIANFAQRQTFYIQSAEAVLKMLLAVLVYYVIPSIIVVALTLSVFRMISLISFFSFSRQKLNINIFRKNSEIPVQQIISTIYVNRYFLFIGTISVLFWSIGGIMVSKLLDIKDVAHYEISYKLFTMAEVVPLMLLNTLFPVILKHVKEKSIENTRFIKILSYASILYGLMAYTFVFSFSGEFIPLLFGEAYKDTHVYCTQMFLTMTIFPSVLFQANLLIALKQEKTDMYLNLMSLLVNISIATIGMYFNRSLSSITYSIFIAFFIFHLSQEYFLIKKGISELQDAIIIYSILFATLVLYPLISQFISVYFLYPFLWIIAIISFIPLVKKSFAKA